MLGFSWDVFGHRVAGRFSPVHGFDRASCIRRIALDQALLETAVAAGARIMLGRTVTSLVGTGTTHDPVRAVVLDGDEIVAARWVFGADGRSSTVARQLGLARGDERRGGQAYLFAYFRGLPASEWIHFEVGSSLAMLSSPCEDGIHLLCLVADPLLTRGTPQDRERRYTEGIRRFPATITAAAIDRAERISPVVAAPETMMRGFYRQASGPGWALVGDAGHVKHPATAQGIGDAVEQARFVADSLCANGNLDGYEQWRDERARDHYEWSFRAGRFGDDDAVGAMFAGLAAEPAVAQQWRDLQTKQRRPADVLTAARRERWRAAWAYEDGRRRIQALIRVLAPHELDTPVPSRPPWTVREVFKHCVDTATAALGRSPRSSPGTDPDDMSRNWEAMGTWLERALRRGEEPLTTSLIPAMICGVGVHLAEIEDTLGLTGDADAAVARFTRSVLAQSGAGPSVPVLATDTPAAACDLCPGFGHAR
jgi:flavin-dependent dehydrogenase